jgi:predicted transcriptional regulator
VIRDVLDRVFGGNPLPLVSSLLEQGDLTREQLEELQRMIERQRRKE